MGTSRMLDPSIVGQTHYNIARGVQKLLQDYRSLQDIILFWVWTICLKKISLPWLVPVRSSVSSPSPSTCPRSSLASQVSSSRSATPSRASAPSSRALVTSSQRTPSTCRVPSRRLSRPAESSLPCDEPRIPPPSKIDNVECTPSA